MATDSETNSRLNNTELAYFILRMGLGINLFFHGLVRFPKLNGFVQYMEKTFSDSMIPKFMVTPMAYGIPIIEFLLGLMLILGLKTKIALVGTALLMYVLITGCCFIENWGPINSQMFLLTISAALIAFLQHNRVALTHD